ncbi:hypothetical protein UFOVP434_35 [uncultured Caudovirales phage]|uniref:Uncharacterized protein n=1 Tax=uncultured Caudovirales phage TaxID=2100421 RepID=A0A6J5MCQ4_9CAUD|nr:hypothetical protein UFOVP434_35 [uncultured Caudovirales phage]
MPQQFQPKNIETPDGKKFTVNSEIEAEDFSNYLSKQGYDVSKLKISPHIKLRETDLLDRVGGAAFGAALGTPGGLPGMAVGGIMGAIAPPKTLGDAGAGIAGALTGGSIGKAVQWGANKVPALAPLARGIGGIIGAETGAVTKSVLDDGKAEGFNPLSAEGLTAAMIPNAGNAISKQIQASPGVLQQRMKNVMADFGVKLPPEKLSLESSMTPAKSVTPTAVAAAKPAANIMRTAAQSTLKPYEDNLQDLNNTRTELVEQLNNYKTNPPKGMFQATQQGAAQQQLAKQLETIDEQLDKLAISKAEATKKALEAKIAFDNSKQTQSGAKGKLSTEKSNIAVEKEKRGLSKERWEETYLQEQSLILNDNTLNPRQRREQLDILRNKFQQTVNQFDQQIGELKIDEKYIDGDLKKVGRALNPNKIAAQTAQKEKANIGQQETELKIARGKVSDELKPLDAQEQAYYKEAERVTGVSIKSVSETVKNFQTALKDKSILPKDIKSLVDASDDMDTFVQTIKTYRPDQIKDVISFLPQSQQAKFKASIGESVVFDFFSKSFNPQTGLLDKMPQYIQKYGIPNLEAYYDSPDAQKTFVQLAEAFQKAIPKDGQFVRNYLKAATIRGVAYNGLTILFGASQYHSGRLATGVAAGVAATMGIAVPQVVAASMKNPKLAADFIKFVDSGGTLTYAQLPYLATFIKKVGKPVTETELADQNNYMKELERANELNQPAQANPLSNPAGINSQPPALPQQQPPQQNQ